MGTSKIRSVVRDTAADMDRLSWLVFVMVVAPFCEGIWRSSSEEDRKHEGRRGVHYHTKRHMLPIDTETKKRPAPPVRGRESRKKVKAKPSGHLTPLKEDDIDNDEVISVAIGPPPMRPLYDKLNWKQRASKNLTAHNVLASPSNPVPNGAISIVKDVLTQIGREFLNHQVNEDFVFGQYVGQAMRNITSEQKLQFQHDILELIVRYQKLSRGEYVPLKPDDKKDPLKMIKDVPKSSKGSISNDTDETWPDFTNIANIVG